MEIHDMTLLEKLMEYRLQLYRYRALRENHPNWNLKEPWHGNFGLSMDECPELIREIREDVLGDKNLENPAE